MTKPHYERWLEDNQERLCTLRAVIWQNIAVLCPEADDMGTVDIAVQRFLTAHFGAEFNGN